MVRSIKRFALFSAYAGVAILVVLCTANAHGQATATLSADVVSEFESVTLTVTDRNRNTIDPDFSALERDFEISQVSTESNIRIVNRRMESTKNWRLELMPKRTGMIDIPPIVVGSSRTNALRLRVNPISASERDFISKTAFFETIISHDKQYPQAAIYVTRRMLYTAEARIPSMPQDKQLEIADATVLPIGSRETLRETRDGVQYYVMQWRYVVFAEKSGALKVPGENARVAIYGNQFRPQIRTIFAEEKLISILPIPDDFPQDKPWFPASKIELTQSFEPADTETLNLGDALTRSITVRARDSYQSALLPLELESIEGLRVYPEQAVVDSILDGDRVWGTQSRSFNLVPVEPGFVSLPEYRLTWWDTEAKELKVTTLPAASFNVPDPAANPNVTRSPQDYDQSSAQQPNELSPSADGSNLWFYLMSIVAIVGWTLALALIYLKNKRRIPRFGLRGESSGVDYGRIRNAFRHGDASTLRHAILHTVAHHFDSDLVTARRLFLASSEGRGILTKLDKLVYGGAMGELEFDFNSIQQVIDSIADNCESDPQQFDLQAVLS